MIHEAVDGLRDTLREDLAGLAEAVGEWADAIHALTSITFFKIISKWCGINNKHMLSGKKITPTIKDNYCSRRN